MKKSSTLSDTESKLLDRGYIRNSDNKYTKTVEKRVDYINETNQIVLTNTFLFKFTAILDDSVLIDSFCEPLRTFVVRTRQDRTALNEIFDEFLEDFCEEWPDGMA